jgi:D-alanine transaminase
MTRTVYVNGTYLPEDQATVSIFDRGFLMADGVYEVTSVLDGKLVDFDGHTRRLHRSLDELDMQAPCSDADLLEMHRELVRLNGIDQGMIYLQVTRGNPGDRSFLFPDGSVKPTIVAFTQDIPPSPMPPPPRPASRSSQSPTSAGAAATSRRCNSSTLPWPR